MLSSFTFPKHANSTIKITDVLKVRQQIALVEKKDVNPTAKDRYFTRNYLLPFLYDCACKFEFNRAKHPRRNVIEERILQAIAERFPISSRIAITLNCLSLGSGGLLQDYMLSLFLLMMNYSLNVNLIEPDKDAEYFRDALAQFKRLSAFATSKGLTFHVAVFASILDYIKQCPEEQIHVAHAIDFNYPNACFNDLLLVHQQLAEPGIFYLALSKHDYMLDEKSLVSAKYSGSWRLFEPRDPSHVMEIPHVNSKIKEKEQIVSRAIPSFNKYTLTNILLYAGTYETARQDRVQEIVGHDLDYREAAASKTF